MQTGSGSEHRMHFDENTVVPINNVNNVIKINGKRIKLNEKTEEIETDNEADDNVGEGIQTNDISSGSQNVVPP